MMSRTLALVAAVLVAAATLPGAARADDVVSLTPSNFDDIVVNSGKNTFVKFFAPWCGHCKRMAPDYVSLAKEYKDSGSVTIAEVDCTAHQSLCTEHGVTGFPTLKSFMGTKEGEKYGSGRSLDAMRTHVEENLDKGCQISNLESCSEKEQNYHTKWAAKTAEDVSKEIERLKGMTSKTMKADLKEWLNSRISLLTQLSAA
ncbi:Protein disulfide isomerase, putative [Hondaea fermentalgiana]|uniref:Protein disulfide isomerase, putative n=1 Tax=Hondaea fermentalgiana TaxID=2315210 RepID=A0A2R5GF04_9STRA|nr:Protein disulfide isomerase, putative [Hondaea fermentalgiana]|eukprot:GBG29506.1 Protein disulfide isomerase, putative [Hondaea fermentalgiana]